MVFRGATFEASCMKFMPSYVAVHLADALSARYSHSILPLFQRFATSETSAAHI